MRSIRAVATTIAATLLLGATPADEVEVRRALEALLGEAQSAWAPLGSNAMLLYGEGGYTVVDGARSVGVEMRAAATGFPGICEESVLTFKVLPESALVPAGPAKLRVRDLDVSKQFALRRIAPLAKRSLEEFRRDEEDCLNPPDDEVGAAYEADDAETAWLAGQAIAQISEDLSRARSRMRYRCSQSSCPTAAEWKRFVTREAFFGASRLDCPGGKSCVTVTLNPGPLANLIWRVTAIGDEAPRAPVFTRWEARAQPLLFTD